MGKFFEALKNYLRKIETDVGAELKRQGKHGSAEIGNVLYTGTAYAPVAPEPELTKAQQSKPQQGQTKSQAGEKEQEQAPAKEREAKAPKQERGGRE